MTAETRQSGQANHQLDIQITIQAGDWPQEDVLLSIIKPALTAAIMEASLAFAREAELSLVFSDDAHIKEINAQWRDMDKSTNVLSFPAVDLSPGESGGQMLGDVIFAIETLRREADLDGKSFEHHLSHLMIHGFLHLFGYDHIDDNEAELMENIEVRALARIGIANPYAQAQQA